MAWSASRDSQTRCNWLQTGHQGSHLTESVSFALLVALRQLYRGLCLFDDNYPQAGPGQPLCIRVVVHFWKSGMRLIALFHHKPLQAVKLLEPFAFGSSTSDIGFRS